MKNKTKAWTYSGVWDYYQGTLNDFLANRNVEVVRTDMVSKGSIMGSEYIMVTMIYKDLG